MAEKNIIRNRVWANLRSVAYPDSRFHWDFSGFIPDFEGSQTCASVVRSSPDYASARCIFVTPDNSLHTFREMCILDQKQLVVPTYGIQRGFWLLKPGDVSAGQEAYAASLDGLEQFGNQYDLKDVNNIPKPELLVTGASILNSKGVRVSDTPSYFDLEWLILITASLVESDTPIIACVHDFQVVDFDLTPATFAVVVDLIITPTTSTQTQRVFPRPSTDAWEQIPWQIIQDIPLLTELYNNSTNHS